MSISHRLRIRDFLAQFRWIILLNLLLWAIIPGLVLGNLHVDTLEALYWARIPAFGYWKHPPLTTWLLGLAAQPGPYSILLTLLLSQALTIITAYFIGRATTSLAGFRTGHLAVALFFVSSLASFYSLQINHNSVLAPFMAATLAFGIDYLEKRKLISIIGLGLAVGLGALAKYEIIFAVLPLFIIALAVPRYRSVFVDARSYISIIIAALMITPHLFWLHDNNWISIKHATDSAPLTNALSLLDGLWGILWGGVAILATPLLMLRVFGFPKLTINLPHYNHDRSIPFIGWTLLILAPLFLIVAGLVSGQFIKSLWLLPLAPSISIGTALMLKDMRPARFEALDKKITSLGMTILFVLFWLYLIVGEIINHPHEAFFSQTRPVAQKIDTLWKQFQTKPLSCVIINEVKIGGAAALWLTDKPLFIEIVFTPWGDLEKQEQCNEEGAIIVELDEGVPAKDYFPRICSAGAEAIHINSLLGQSNTVWKGRISYLPPEGQICPN